MARLITPEEKAYAAELLEPERALPRNKLKTTIRRGLIACVRRLAGQLTKRRLSHVLP